MILGLAGYAGAGKNTAADRLVDAHGWVQVALADPMRDALYALDPMITSQSSLAAMVDLYGWDDLKRDETYGPEVRRLLQRFGTEVGRNKWGVNFWVDLLETRIADGSGRDFVITDVRFRNEAETIRRWGGQVWRVERLGLTAANDHSSEHDLRGYSFDGTLWNASDVEALHYAVDVMVKQLGVTS